MILFFQKSGFPQPLYTMLSLALVQLVASDRPKFPASYHIRGVWSIPYWQIRIPFVVDTKEGVAQSDRSYDLEHNIHLWKGKKYAIQTNHSGYSCSYSNFSGDSDSFIEYLPDLTDKNTWADYGEHQVLGRQAVGYIKKTEQGYKYIFYVDKQTNLPLRYHQFGQSIRHSHPAEYILDIEEFSPFPNETNFLPPAKGCFDISSGGPTVHTRALGRDISAPRKKSNAPLYCDMHKPEPVDISGIKDFSWRNVPGVVQPVRDQSNCGSCWAQSAAEAISGQVNLAIPNRNFTVSVQQIIDCVWTSQSFACAGGEGYDAYRMMASLNLSISTEEQYPYLGVSGTCQRVTDMPLGYVKGCYQIEQDPSDKDINVLRALYQYGPLMIYMKAGTAPFVAYTGGSFNNPDVCSGIKEHDQTDHGVLLTGWKTINGVIHYEIMNSWSTFWGEEGFAYISTENDCGVPVMPLLPLVEVNHI